MSKAIYQLDASIREDMGKGASRRLRRADAVPAILYGGGESPVSLTLDHNKLINALEHESFYSHILTLKIADKSHKVILKDLQRHAYKPKVLHADFLRVNPKEKLTMSVPLHFINEGEALGVKSGGNVAHLKTELEIVCLPKDLPEFIEVDIAKLELGQTLHLSDIKLPKGVEHAHAVDDEHNAAVVSIHVAKAQTESEPAADEASEPEA